MADASVDQGSSILQHNLSDAVSVLQSLRKLEPQVEIQE